MSKVILITGASAAIDASIDHGSSTDIFAPVIEKIINSRYVKRYYRIGKPIEKLSVTGSCMLSIFL